MDEISQISPYILFQRQNNIQDLRLLQQDEAEKCFSIGLGFKKRTNERQLLYGSKVYYIY